MGFASNDGTHHLGDKFCHGLGVSSLSPETEKANAKD